MCLTPLITETHGKWEGSFSICMADLVYLYDCKTSGKHSLMGISTFCKHSFYTMTKTVFN